MKKVLIELWFYTSLMCLGFMFLSSCEYEPFEPYEDTKPLEKELDDYSKSWDIIRNYPSEVVSYRDFGYFSECGFDTTAVIADFDLNGSNDIMLSPQCTDDDQRQPPVKIFFSINKEYVGKVVSATGPMAGARTTIVGDYNGDKIPDVFFIAHNGHGYDFGVPSIFFPILSLLDKSHYRHSRE